MSGHVVAISRLEADLSGTFDLGARRYVIEGYKNSTHDIVVGLRDGHSNAGGGLLRRVASGAPDYVGKVSVAGEIYRVRATRISSAHPERGMELVWTA